MKDEIEVPMFGMQSMTAATIGGALVFGMTLALLGRLKLAVVRRASAEGGTARGWLMALNIALIPLMLLSGVLIDIYGARPVLVAGSGLLAVALVSLGLRFANASGSEKTSPQTLAAMLLAGFGASALGAASIVLMPHAFYPAANAAGSSHFAAALNLGFVFIALGALLTPVFTDILLETMALRRTLAVLALLALMPAFLGALPDSEHRPIAEHDGHLSALLAEPACWLTALVMFFYVPLEAALGSWTCTLLAEREQKESEAAGLLTGFWAAFLASRLLAALGQQTFSFSYRVWEWMFLVAAPLLAAVLLGNLAGSGQRGRPRGGLILLGLLLGPVLPSILSLLFRAAPNENGTAFGLVFAAGSLGSLVLAPFLSLRLPIFLALLVAASALVLGLMTP